MQNRGFKRGKIELFIKENINKWLKTITDETLREDIRQHYIVTGGAITSMLLGELPNDYDVYLDDIGVAERVAWYYATRMKTLTNVVVGLGRVKMTVTDGIVKGAKKALKSTKETYSVLAITENAITLTGQIQIILRFVGPAEEIHRNYDFVHTTNWYTEKTGLVLNEAALESTLSKQLKYVGSQYPLCSLFRIKKFLSRGWTINAGEMLKIAYDISKLDFQNIDVLKDQLVGVDSMYFKALIAQIEKEGKPIDRTYLFSLVNQVFDKELEGHTYEVRRRSGGTTTVGSSFS